MPRYIQLRDIPRGSVNRTSTVHPDVLLDLDHRDELVGIEILAEPTDRAKAVIDGACRAYLLKRWERVMKKVNAPLLEAIGLGDPDVQIALFAIWESQYWRALALGEEP